MDKRCLWLATEISIKAIIKYFVFFFFLSKIMDISFTVGIPLILVVGISYHMGFCMGFEFFTLSNSKIRLLTLPLIIIILIISIYTNTFFYGFCYVGLIFCGFSRTINKGRLFRIYVEEKENEV